MTTAEAMEQVEGDTFAAYGNLASDLKTFLRVLASRPEVHILAGAMRMPGVAEQVGERALELARRPVEEGREHPADAALAAYLWLLDTADPPRGQVIATAVQAGSFWWARKMADRIGHPGLTSSNGSQRIASDSASSTSG
jgi:hypothetical protein